MSEQHGPWTIQQIIPVRDGLTISKPALSGSRDAVTWFSLGGGTDISPERYDRWAVYLGGFGTAAFTVGTQEDRWLPPGGNPCVTPSACAPAASGEGKLFSPEPRDRRNHMVPAASGEQRLLSPGGLLVIPAGTLCGTRTAQGAIYTEIIMDREDMVMNERITPGSVFELKDLIDYEEGSVVNCNIVTNAGLRYALMAFDQGTGLQPHRAPGNAIVTAIEGTGVIGYEGEEFELKEGESFRFAKDGLHSVTARSGRFKMSLLLIRE